MLYNTRARLLTRTEWMIYALWDFIRRIRIKAIIAMNDAVKTNSIWRACTRNDRRRSFIESIYIWTMRWRGWVRLDCQPLCENGQDCFTVRTAFAIVRCNPGGTDDYLLPEEWKLFAKNFTPFQHFVRMLYGLPDGHGRRVRGEDDDGPTGLDARTIPTGTANRPSTRARAVIRRLINRPGVRSRHLLSDALSL